MKRLIYKSLILLCVPLAFSGCKKFLNVTPIDNLSGNNYWQTKSDVENFTRGIYATLRIKIAGPSAGGYFPAMDLRCAPIKKVANGYEFINQLRTNNFKGIQSDNKDWTGGYAVKNLTTWNAFYDMIQSANILLVQIDKIPDPNFTSNDKKHYRAEAVFLRNLAYFFMVRQFGDVAYYTKAYNSEPLERMPMVQVLNLCLEDMNKYKNDLPWTYEDPSTVGIRAMRGGAIALMMHMNMWAAGFDEPNKLKYYTAVKQLGAELMNNGGNYELLPMTREESKKVFKGRTKESLFEVLQNVNYGEVFAAYASLSSLLVHYPYLGSVTTTNSVAAYEKKFMEKLYSDGSPDLRKELWFENRLSENGSFQFTKLINTYGGEGQNIKNDDNMIIFRLPDALLLTAEALAELGEDNEAQKMLNMVRKRAGALDVTSTGGALKDEIYWERCRELMGEGHYYYDLVRTKKVMNDKYCSYPISVSDFNQGAWTFPIDPSAMNNNPKMTLNNFWR
ncbi:RagB/SusD family nutrient uptake outer membrane protein [Pedobacter gandavensis]|uniref:RagB/SusD family nutrient uptake outer membrane protein n=1 Tax=Pedobacter gandavensis TaxID=2679963 RepID=A0ABR6EXM4_9SPHI|nr:RagB/SusD family nutrient uptake outer membrane protein [Pedobacter gandavensis]MBB2150035.1 RagB/SusD family nutrient uptake outer membrane protein [Pedobacter gandavensis]